MTHLRAKVEMSRQFHVEESPVLIADRNSSRARPPVVDRFPKASGVTDGMTPQEAVSRHTNTVGLGTSEPHYRRVVRTGARTCQ